MSEPEPMPDPFTTRDTGHPVGLWMPGKFYTKKYLKWRKEKDDAAAKGAEDFELAPGLFNGEWRAEPGGRECSVCGRGFTPSRANQKTCSWECSRENRLTVQRETARKRYQPRPIADRVCEICGKTYTPIKVTAKTCGATECQDALRRIRIREHYQRNKKEVA